LRGLSNTYWSNDCYDKSFQDDDSPLGGLSSHLCMTLEIRPCFAQS
jgi:hypothetical protein